MALAPGHPPTYIDEGRNVMTCQSKKFAHGKYGSNIFTLMVFASALHMGLFAEETSKIPGPNVAIEVLNKEDCLAYKGKTIKVSGALVEYALGWGFEGKDFFLLLCPKKAYAPDSWGKKASALGVVEQIDLKSALPEDEALNEGHKRLMVLILKAPIEISITTKNNDSPVPAKETVKPPEDPSEPQK